LILNHSSPDLAIIFIPETKNKGEEKAIRHYFGYPQGFDRGHFDSKEDSAEFLKLYDSCKHCISSESICIE